MPATAPAVAAAVCLMKSLLVVDIEDHLVHCFLQGVTLIDQRGGEHPSVRWMLATLAFSSAVLASG
jgi:hypothetical protein